MSFLKRVFASSSSQGEDPNAIWLYVRCKRCREKLRIRVDKQHDLFPSEEGEGYTLRKEMMDGRCFQLMYGDFTFDPKYNLVSSEIEGGELITREEYEAKE